MHSLLFSLFAEGSHLPSQPGVCAGPAGGRRARPEDADCLQPCAELGGSQHLQKPTEGKLECSAEKSLLWCFPLWSQNRIYKNMFFYFLHLQAFSSSLAPLQRVVEDINDQASDFTANNVALSRQILQRLEDINTR